MGVERRIAEACLRAYVRDEVYVLSDKDPVVEAVAPLVRSAVRDALERAALRVRVEAGEEQLRLKPDRRCPLAFWFHLSDLILATEPEGGGS